MNVKNVEMGVGQTMCGGIPLKAGIITMGSFFIAHFCWQAFLLVFGFIGILVNQNKYIIGWEFWVHFLINLLMFVGLTIGLVMWVKYFTHLFQNKEQGNSRLSLITATYINIAVLVAAVVDHIFFTFILHISNGSDIDGFLVFMFICHLVGIPVNIYWIQFVKQWATLKN